MEKQEDELACHVVGTDVWTQICRTLESEGLARVKLKEQDGSAVVLTHCSRLGEQPPRVQR
jgi:hypothetical protein